MLTSLQKEIDLRISVALNNLQRSFLSPIIFCFSESSIHPQLMTHLYPQSARPLEPSLSAQQGPRAKTLPKTSNKRRKNPHCKSLWFLKIFVHLAQAWHPAAFQRDLSNNFEISHTHSASNLPQNFILCNHLHFFNGEMIYFLTRFWKMSFFISLLSVPKPVLTFFPPRIWSVCSICVSDCKIEM